MVDLEQRLDEQQRYYRRRAGDFHDWVTDYTQPVRPQLVRPQLVRLPRAAPLRGHVLELAAGTGYWTEDLSRIAERVTALDGAPEMVDVLAARGLPNVTVGQQDLFDWEPTGRWDAIFFANWLAHVPAQRLEPFWTALDAALVPGGRVVFVDVTDEERGIEQRFWSESATDFVERQTLDGEQFAVVKHYWDPHELLALLQAWGWTGTATPIGKEDGRGFVFYSVGRLAEARS